MGCSRKKKRKEKYVGCVENGRADIRRRRLRCWSGREQSNMGHNRVRREDDSLDNY